ncbi:hypothetical protein HPB50_023225 [Hyalomma asiaticum]|uniref:Uncharacterized protein n=1 Tax=Hyalomma asiaticum TaxID=266040 RepID=A0ACB7SSA7_HYAAI|nr:hypothetical protein HPB50_023225 [Hyalomma asiaticum]
MRLDAESIVCKRAEAAKNLATALGSRPVGCTACARSANMSVRSCGVARGEEAVPLPFSFGFARLFSSSTAAPSRSGALANARLGATPFVVA